MLDPIYLTDHTRFVSAQSVVISPFIFLLFLRANFKVVANENAKSKKQLRI